MPNHCNNVLTLHHSDAREIGRAKLAILNGTFFQEFATCPQDLLETTAGYLSGDAQLELEAKNKSNLEKYGFANWYDWNVATWGTKWDAYDCEITDESADSNGADLTVTFDTAWAPPTPFYAILVEQGFVVNAKYNEFGCAFCGSYTNEYGDEYYEYSSDDYTSIPEDIDECFAISETLEMWNEDEEEESTEN